MNPTDILVIFGTICVTLFVVRVLKLLVNTILMDIMRRTRAGITLPRSMGFAPTLTLDVMNGVIAPLIESHVQFGHSLSEAQMAYLYVWQNSY